MMNDEVLLVCGTNRSEALTRRVTARVAARLDEELRPFGAGTRTLDLADLEPDLFLPEAYAKKPEWFVERFQEPLLRAKGVVTIVPEYNGSFPGALKYFIDMLSFPESLLDTPTAFIGLSTGRFGGVRAVEQLELIYHYRGAHLFGARLFLPHAHEAVQDDGSLGPYEERLGGLVTGFVKFCGIGR